MSETVQAFCKKMLELTGLYEEKKQAVDFEKCQVRELLDNVRQLMKFKLSEKKH